MPSLQTNSVLTAGYNRQMLVKGEQKEQSHMKSKFSQLLSMEKEEEIEVKRQKTAGFRNSFEKESQLLSRQSQSQVSQQSMKIIIEAEAKFKNQRSDEASSRKSQ